MEIFFRDQQHIVYEIRLIVIREVSPPFGEEHRGLEQDIYFPANKPHEQHMPHSNEGLSNMADYASNGR